jgi:peptidoglycan/LPS O-acetylase OafA/YrhL
VTSDGIRNTHKRHPECCSRFFGTVIYRFRGVLPNLSKGPASCCQRFNDGTARAWNAPGSKGWDALAIFLFLPAILTPVYSAEESPTRQSARSWGEISYPIYAVHVPVFLLLSGFRHSIFPSLNVSAVISIGVLSALLAAIALNHFDKWLRIHLSRKSTFAPSTFSRPERSARPCDETATAKPSRLRD